MWHVRHTLALMCAKNNLLIFSSFLDIWENVEWPRFLDHPVGYMPYVDIHVSSMCRYGQKRRLPMDLWTFRNDFKTQNYITCYYTSNYYI